MTDTLTPVLTAHWDQERSWTLAAYEQTGGYAALRKAVAMPAADVLGVVKASSIRGRGGAGRWAGLVAGPEDRSRTRLGRAAAAGLGR